MSQEEEEERKLFFCVEKKQFFGNAWTLKMVTYQEKLLKWKQVTFLLKEDSATAFSKR